MTNQIAEQLYCREMTNQIAEYLYCREMTNQIAEYLYHTHYVPLQQELTMYFNSLRAGGCGFRWDKHWKSIQCTIVEEILWERSHNYIIYSFNEVVVPFYSS